MSKIEEMKNIKPPEQMDLPLGEKKSEKEKPKQEDEDRTIYQRYMKEELRRKEERSVPYKKIKIEWEAKKSEKGAETIWGPKIYENIREDRNREGERGVVFIAFKSNGYWYIDDRGVDPKEVFHFLMDDFSQEEFEKLNEELTKKAAILNKKKQNKES